MKRESLILIGLISVLFLDFGSARAEEDLPLLDLETESAPAPKAQVVKKDNEAERLFHNKEFSKVIELISPKLDTAAREDFLLLARSYSESKNPVMAQKTLVTGLAKFKGDKELGTELGSVLLQMAKDPTAKDALEAKSILKDVIERHPKYEPAYLAMAQIYEKRQNRYELRLLYQDLIEQVGPRPIYLTKLCDNSVREGLYDLAFKYCQAAVRSNAKEPLNYVNLATTYKETGQSEKADAQFKKAADSFSKSELAQSSYASFLDQSKHFTKSYGYWKRATDADPKSIRAWTGYAFAALEIQKFAEAYNGFDKLCELDRGAEKQIRRASNSLKTSNQAEWLAKFAELTTKCEVRSDARGFL